MRAYVCMCKYLHLYIVICIYVRAFRFQGLPATVHISLVRLQIMISLPQQPEVKILHSYE